jgi:L-seryl-tRNA(Ser) seleniumtransferase
LQETALAYLRRDGAAIPFWRLATAPVDALRTRAAALAAGHVVDCASVAGGGSLPGLEIPSAGIAVTGDRTAELRAGDPPIVARVIGNRTILDLRTVDPADDAIVAKAVSALASP